MALPHLVTDSERTWIEKQLTELSSMSERDLCIWSFSIGTPCTILELNRIQIGDVVTKSGKLVKEFVIRGELAFNGQNRTVLFKNKKFTKVLESYLEWLCESELSRGEHPDYYKGLDPLKPLFITKEGKEFSLTKTKTTYKPDSLRRHIMNIMVEGGIENPSSQSGRRTFATKLQRNNRHISQINHLLGHKSLEATKRLIGNDPVDMGAIAAEAF